MSVMNVELRDVRGIEGLMGELAVVAGELEAIVNDIEGGSFLDEPHRLSVQAITVRSVIDELQRLSGEVPAPSTDYFLG